ncbi:TetR/AcrR family transcriptional regulator [Nonomuraea spiralis]|uniref:TetR/AcrR family transcriptional regulator n=1 Tax=Nonomuraea spiralis TaxID=46182 RepID=A0ABV5IFY0_9ACTN|nr:TetR/AcrR family transcriptional regulator [Nonomuraea spiralis]GGT38929.1 HTH-type transcriptional regulator EthR [Nonomuraea spiralis]
MEARAGRRAPRPKDDDRDLREVILAATRGLLDERRFDELSVADILAAAQVARGSFYFYFASKHEVLAELVRRAIARGHEVAQPWLTHDEPDQRRASVRHGILQGARLWREEAPVLRAIVENWRTDPELTALWHDQMAGFTAVTTERITSERTTGPDVDPAALGAALTWLGERLYYLAALDVAPFADEDTLVEVLTHIWMTALYSEPGS